MKEFKQGMATKTLGIMIHHLRMNQQDSIFLEYLLETLNEYEKITIVTYDDLIQP
jgi:hypothetical protein